MVIILMRSTNITPDATDAGAPQHKTFALSDSLAWPPPFRPPPSIESLASSVAWRAYDGGDDDGVSLQKLIESFRTDKLMTKASHAGAAAAAEELLLRYPHVHHVT